MANNPYVNKVQKADGTVLMDVSGDTVTPNDVRNGVTFHDRSGAQQQGGLIISPVYDGLDSSSTTDALSANMGRELNGKLAYKELLKTINTGFTEYTLEAGDYPDGFTSANSMIVSVTCKAYNALNNGQQEYAWINGTNKIQYYLSGSNSRQITLQVLFMKT